jgi:hypothetical protein
VLAAAAGVTVTAIGLSAWYWMRRSKAARIVSTAAKPQRSLVSHKDFELFDAAVSFVRSPPDGADFELASKQVCDCSEFCASMDNAALQIYRN